MSLFRSIRAQLAASVGLLVLLIVATAGIVIVAQMDALDRASLDAQLRSRADRVGDDLGKVVGDHEDVGGRGDEYGDLLAGSQSLVRVIVDGVVAAERGDIPQTPIPVPGSPGFGTITVDGVAWRSLVVTERSGADVQVLQSLEPLDQRVAANALLVAAVTAGATLLAVLGGGLVAGAVLRPLDVLTRGARRIRDARHVEDRLPRVSSPAEIAGLSATLDDMLDRLELSTAATRRFTADAGHELRTPLAGIAANLEIVLRNPGLPADDRHAMLEQASAEISRMTALLDGLQRLARGDALALPAREQVDLSDVVADAVARARRRHPGIRFAFDDLLPAEAEPVAVWRDGVRLAVENLLDNAALHGREEGDVVVALREAGDSVEIAVEDDGPGIPPDRRAALRERFARGQGTRSPGSGLGLALVDQQAVLHGGALELGESPLGGLAATLSLPRAGS